ncbi:MAG TPA: TSUP family transporter [Steroidobacteraceae bacterium]|nr:TSUP family transporter [Steroidobacteraceae bacterium]
MTLEIVLVLLAAFGAGLVDSMVGGGGLIQVPAIFAAFPQTAPATALGTNKIASILGTIGAVARFARSIRIPWRVLLPFIPLVVIGASAGAFTVTLVPPDLLRPLVPVLLTVVLLYMLRRPTLGGEHQPRALAGQQAWLATSLIGAIAFYEGFFGPGTGSFFMFVFIRLYGFDFLHSAASARFLNAAANASASVWFAARGHVLWEVGIAMAVANVVGAQVGTRVALKHGSALVRKVFIAVVSALILKTAWDALH